MNLLRSALAHRDASPSDWSTPDPDEAEGPCRCDVCGEETAPFILHVCTRRREYAKTSTVPKQIKRRRGGGVGGRFMRVLVRSPKRPVVCSGCRVKGWRGRWCACGAVMHKRDYRLKACGKCRAEMNDKVRWLDAP